MVGVMESLNTLSIASLFLILLSVFCTVIFVFIMGRMTIYKSPLDQKLSEACNRALSRKEYGDVLSQSYLRQQLKQQEEEQVKKAASLVIRGVLDHFFNKPFFRNDQAKLTFSQAGWPTKNAQLYYLLAKIITFILSFCITFWLLATVQSLQNYLMIVYVTATLVGWSAFDWFLHHVIKDRAERIENGLASALDLMMICVGAGLSFQKSMDRVAREIAPYNTDIGKELAITSLELEILLDTKQAVMNLAERVPSPIVRSFAMTMVQSMQQGTQISRSLDAIAGTIRQQRLQAAEIKASRLPSLLVIPLVLFTLPNIFIVLLGPSLVKVLKVLGGTP